MFVHSIGSLGERYAAILKKASAGAIQILSPPVPSGSVSMFLKLSTIVLDNISEDSSEWLERSNRFNATVDRSLVEYNAEMKHLKVWLPPKQKRQSIRENGLSSGSTKLEMILEELSWLWTHNWGSSRLSFHQTTKLVGDCQVSSSGGWICDCVQLLLLWDFFKDRDKQCGA